MIALARDKFGIPFTDLIFVEDPKLYQRRSPLTRFSQSAKPLPGFIDCLTKIIDLSKATSANYNDLSSNTRYKIKRALREGIVPRFNPTPNEADIEIFSSHYDKFASQKGLPLCNRYKLKLLNSLAALILTTAHNSHGELLVTHAYIADRDSKRLRLLYSASLFRGINDTEERNLIGRANRLLHWFEIESAPNFGYLHYDLGGFPTNTKNPDKSAIARFKGEFGGREVREYNGLTSSIYPLRLALRQAQRLISSA
jgi:hypothetical protein